MKIFNFILIGLLLYITTRYLNTNNIEDYFDRPYCQKVKLGSKDIEKCWRLQETKEICKLVKDPNPAWPNTYNNICEWVDKK